MTLFGSGYGPRRSSGCLRYVIAAVIAIGAIVAYYTHTEVNPVTGEKQHVAMTPNQEIALGLQSAPKMAAEMGGALDPAKDPDAAAVSRIGQQLAQSTDAARSPYAGNFHYYLLADPKTVNAFALPGGQVFITRALYGRLQNTAQLAGVLGHETGHVINRHAAEHMATGQLGGALAAAAGVAASDNRGHGYTAAVIAQAVNQMIQLKYSRNDELEADAYGLKYMTQAGYDPSSMLDVMRILKESAASAGRGPNILSTHPDPDARIQAIQAYLQKNYPNGVPSNLTEGQPLR
jgi:predicted Zn-dependent protease